ncbi:MAG: hypothetical protein IKX51_04005 [Bacteroidales bacterium]|nr:hypothetical protein [Bacteroidales bacterium]
MKRLSFIFAVVTGVAALMFATSCDKEEHSDILGDWYFEEVIVEHHSATLDTTYIYTENAFFRDIAFYDDGTANVEVKSGYTVYPPAYYKETFRWELNKQETALTMKANDWNDMNWEVLILNKYRLKFSYKERYSDGTTKKFYYTYSPSQRSNSRPRN